MSKRARCENAEAVDCLPPTRKAPRIDNSAGSSTVCSAASSPRTNKRTRSQSGCDDDDDDDDDACPNFRRKRMCTERTGLEHSPWGHRSTPADVVSSALNFVYMYYQKINMLLAELEQSRRKRRSHDRYAKDSSLLQTLSQVAVN